MVSCGACTPYRGACTPHPDACTSYPAACTPNQEPKVTEIALPPGADEFAPEEIGELLQRGVLRYLWPVISSHIVQVLATNLEPQLQKLFASAGGKVCFDTARSAVGQQPLRVREVTSERKDDTPGGNQDNLSLVAFELDSDTAIALKVKDGKSTIQRVLVRGPLTIQYFSSTSSDPLPDCIRVFFMDTPELIIDWLSSDNLSEEWAHDTNVLHGKIINAAVSSIGRFMGLPNMMAFPIVRDMDILDTKMLCAAGALSVHVRLARENEIASPGDKAYASARQDDQGTQSEQCDDCNECESQLGFLQGYRSYYRSAMSRLSDWSWSGLMTCKPKRAPSKELSKEAMDVTMEPWVEVRCGMDMPRAETLLDIFALRASHTGHFLICDTSQQRIVVSVYDDVLSVGLGFGSSASLSVADMLTWGSEEMSVDILDSTHGFGSKGKVWMRCTWRPLCQVGIPLEITHPSSVHALFVGVYGVLGLPRFGVGTLHWVTAVCKQVDGMKATKLGPKLAETVRKRHSSRRLEACTNLLRQKLEILRDHDLDLKAAAMVDIDEAEAPFAAKDHPTTSSQDLRWEHLFSFIIGTPADSELNLTLMHRLSGGTKDIVTDRYDLQLGEVLIGDRRGLCQTGALRNTGALLELRLELRDLGTPSVYLAAI